MKYFTALAAAALVALPALAQDEQGSCDNILNIDANARVDFQQNFIDGHTVRSNSGFEGKNLNLMLSGNIIPGLEYGWRQRLNKSAYDANFFDATDWIYLDYHLKGWDFMAGKYVVGIGGWEYDRAPIDAYTSSVFTSNIPCYEMGAAIGYKFNRNTYLRAQVTQSPFFTKENRDLYAYNLYFTGNYGFYHAIHSVNLVGYEKGKYISYIALGNKFDFGKVSIDLDLMNRAASHQAFLFKDCSVVGEVSYRPTDRWNIFAKASYDVNKSGTDADFCVLDGTELTMVGLGAEFYPLRKKNTDLRVHANLFYSWGTNTNAGDVMQDKSLLVNCGVTWYMHIYSLKRKPKCTAQI